MPVTKQRGAAAFWEFREIQMTPSERTWYGLTLAAACAQAQSPTPATPLSFEVASLKPAPPPSGRGMRITDAEN